MKDRIIEMLGRDERVALECVDKQAYIAETGDHNKLMLRESGLIVSRVNSYGAVITDDDWLILNNELKYFKIKESTPTFNDLIDVAVKAWKDGYLKVLELEKGIVDQVFTAIDGIAYAWHDGDDDYSRALDTIKSLYAETFVIESKVDLNKLKTNAVVTLKNSEKIVFSNKFEDGFFFDVDSFNSTTIPFIALKGATVTQKRGDS